MSIIEETSLRNWLESIKPIIAKEDCSFLTSLIDGTETILTTSYSEEKIKSFLENIPLYHEVAKYNLYNYLIENFINMKASFGFYDLDIVEKKNEVQLVTVADSVLYPIVKCMFFDRFKGELPFHEGRLINYATISIFTREKYSKEEREFLVEHNKRIKAMLESVSRIQNDPLVCKKDEQIKELLDAEYGLDSLNTFINFCSSYFCDGFLPSVTNLTGKENVDGSSIEYDLGTGILVKKIIVKV